MILEYPFDFNTSNKEADRCAGRLETVQGL